MMDALTANNFVLPMLTLFGGWLLGLFSSAFLENMRRKQSIQGKLFDQYLIVRKEITAAISQIISQTRPQLKSPGAIALIGHAEEISRLYFTHFDLLPSEVVSEMICLYSCLLKAGKHIYCKDGKDRIVPLNLNSEKALTSFLKKISMVRNLMYYAPGAIRSTRQDVRRNTIIRCQAFSVLASLNRYFGKKILMSWDSSLAKFPITDNANSTRTRQITE